MSLRKRRLHHDRGVTDFEALARLDDRTARVLAGTVDLDRPPRYGRSELDPNRPRSPSSSPAERRQIADLASQSVLVVGDLDALPGNTFGYRDAAMGDLPDQIDRARARLGPLPAYRLRGVDALEVPRADVEIDRGHGGRRAGHLPVGVLHTAGDGDDPPAASLPALRLVGPEPTPDRGARRRSASPGAGCAPGGPRAAEAGRSLRAYCYNKGAEGTHMPPYRRPAGPRRPEVARRSWPRTTGSISSP